MSDHKYVVAQTQDVVLGASVVVFQNEDKAAFARYQLNGGKALPSHLQWKERKWVLPNRLCVAAEKSLIDRVGQVISYREARVGEIVQLIDSKFTCEVFPLATGVVVVLDTALLPKQWACTVDIFSRVGWTARDREGKALNDQLASVKELVNGPHVVYRSWAPTSSVRAAELVTVIGRIDFDTNTLLSITRAPGSGESCRQTWACFKGKLPMTAGSVPVPPGTTTLTGKPPEITPTFIDGVSVDECLRRYEEAMKSDTGLSPYVGARAKLAASLGVPTAPILTIAQLKAAQGAWSEKLKKLVETAAQKRKKDKMVYVQPEFDPWD